MSDFKARVRRALTNHHANLIKKYASTRKNKKPEKEVEAIAMAWMRAKDWDVEIYEAKATFDPKRQIWRQQAMKAGVCDCMGLDNLANAVFVEFKAPGRRSDFNSDRKYKQKKFLTDKIHRGAFGVVIDSVAELERIYSQWLAIDSRKEKIAYLISELP